jgi:aspartyl-tRNA(Asn)/glutamyl-tRNA(Gln) amidotransferase subunit A
VSELHWLSAEQISAEYAARRLSPVELVQALLDRIVSHNPRVNAFISVDAEGALAAARQAEKDIGAGRVLGPLHGVPVGIKDSIDIAGLATTCHSKIMLGNIAREDAPVISHLRSAGAILLGKLAMHEFGFGGPTFDGPFPPARNPWNLAHHPGGSSSGSGAAIGAGLVPVTLGTDTAGSIRNPAGACGGVGLKPTYDLLSRRGVFPLAYSLDVVGPLARTVPDIAASLDVLVGPGTGTVSGDAHRRPFGRDLQRGLRGLRIGFVRHFHESDEVADADVAQSLEEVLAVLKDGGANVRDIRLPDLHEMQSVTGVIWLAEAWAIHAKWLRERPGDYTEATRRKVMAGAFLTAGDYVHAQQGRLKMIDAVDEAFRDVDILLTASTYETPCRIDDTVAYGRNYPRQARSPFSATGHPAIAMVCGMSAGGLPLTMQMVGRAYDEITLLRAAAAYERATPWHTMRAPVQ